MARYLARLKQHWVRHLLAALQVAVGVAVVTAILVDVVPLIRWTEGRQSETFSVTYGTRTAFTGMRASVFTLEDLHLLTDADTIAAATVFDSIFTPIIRADGDLWVVRGAAKVSPGLVDVADIEMTAGRFFTDEDTQVPEPQVAVISTELAESIFGDRDPIGEVINIRPTSESLRLRGSTDVFLTEDSPGLDVRVVGVFAYPPGTTVFEGIFENAPKTELLIPATGRHVMSLVGAYSSFVLPDTGDESPLSAVPQPVVDLERYDEIYFRAEEGKAMEAEAEARALLDQIIASRRDGYDDTIGGHEPRLLIDPIQSQSMRQARLRSFLVVGVMAIAALIVSGFAVFTTFLASVAERVRLIGLARAIGATRGRVLREVVAEAVLLSGIGGVIGLLLTYPMRRFIFSSAVGGAATAPGAVDVTIALLIGILMAVGIGAVASLYPGWTVARLLPAEAFHEE